MKKSFDDIVKLLDDPFFEVQTLGKEAIRQRTLPVDRYGEAPSSLPFRDWTAEDDRETIRYSFHDTAIGRLLLADTVKGLCFSGFACRGDAEVMSDFTGRFPGQSIKEDIGEHQGSAVKYCNGNREHAVPLHMKGTDFQLGIWKQLVRIPEGRLSSYGSLAPNAGGSQAIGAAVGANPISYIVPCHRIVKSDGDIRGYHWGTDVKKRLLAYELQNIF